MGTHATITVICNGRKFRTYVHYDGDSVHGVLKVELRALLARYGLEGLKERVNSVKIVTHNKDKPTASDKLLLQDYTNLKVSEQCTDDWYCLLHKTQGSLLRIINAGYALEHEGDSMEYNYVIDLDEGFYDPEPHIPRDAPKKMLFKIEEFSPGQPDNSTWKLEEINFEKDLELPLPKCYFILNEKKGI